MARRAAIMNKALQLYDALDRDTERAKCLIGDRLEPHARKKGRLIEVIDYFTQALEIYRQPGRSLQRASVPKRYRRRLFITRRPARGVQAVEQCLAFFSLDRRAG